VSHSPVTRHDLVLATIAAPMVIAALVGFLSSLAMSTALAAGSLPATGSLGYALFYQPPGD
jgi:hypothetical protein